MGPPPSGPSNGDSDERPGRGRRIGLVVAGVLLVGLIAGGVVWATNRPDEATPASDNKSTPPTTESSLPADEQCTDAIKSNPRWVCLTSARYVDGELVVKFDAEWAGSEPDINGGFHLHLFGSDGTDPAAEIMGRHAGSSAGKWVVKDESPAVLSPENIAEAIGDNPKVCARIAQGEHELVQDENGGYDTGNCVKIRGERPEQEPEGQDNPAPAPNPPPAPPTTTEPTTTEPTTTEPTTTEPPAPTAAEGGAAPAGETPAGEAEPAAVPAEP